MDSPVLQAPSEEIHLELASVLAQARRLGTMFSDFMDRLPASESDWSPVEGRAKGARTAAALGARRTKTPATGCTSLPARGT